MSEVRTLRPAAVRRMGRTPPLAVQDVVDRAAPQRRLDLWLLLAPLIGITLLAKLSVPPLGVRGIALGVGLPLAVGGLGLLLDRMHLAPGRTAGLLAVCALLFGGALLRAEPFSPMSLLLFSVLHLPYALVLRDDAALRERVQGLFVGVAVAVGLAGIAQIALQLLFSPAVAFPIENWAPKGFVIDAFNQQTPIDYGAELYRANGVVMLEPSFFSQLVAVAIVAELCGRNRRAVLALLALALLLSYSGTGLLVLLLALPVLVIERARLGLLLAAALAVLVVVVGAEAMNFDLFAKRAAEFADPGSSGFARFVGGFYLWDQFLWHEPLRALFGYGAGSFDRYEALAAYPVAQMALTKMVFEFGVVGGLAYFGFIACCLASAPAPLALRVAVFCTYLLNGLYGSFAHGLALSLLLWPAAVTPAPPRPRRLHRPAAALEVVR
ncbi:MAG TPA: hypothetical protein VLI72_01480 [Methylibium sp.]|nr:hypothetical protein [Methylibium sp.]